MVNNDYDVSSMTVCSHASSSGLASISEDKGSSGLASIYKDKGKDKICYKIFSAIEETKSLTWRERKAMRLVMTKNTHCYFH